MLIIWKDWDGDLYAFCSRECLECYKKHLTDPSDPHEKATSTEHSFGCWWCGVNLAEGVTWLKSEPEDCCGGEPATSTTCDKCGCREAGNASFTCTRHRTTGYRGARVDTRSS